MFIIKMIEGINTGMHNHGLQSTVCEVAVYIYIYIMKYSIIMPIWLIIIQIYTSIYEIKSIYSEFTYIAQSL